MVEVEPEGFAVLAFGEGGLFDEAFTRVVVERGLGFGKDGKVDEGVVIEVGGGDEGDAAEGVEAGGGGLFVAGVE